MGVAFLAYAQDYDEKFPNDGIGGTGNACNGVNDPCGRQFGWDGWIGNALIPFIKTEGVFVCPDRNANGWQDPRASMRQGSYEFNYRTCYGINISQIQEPANGLCMWDSDSGWADCNYEDGGCGWRTRDWAWFVAQNGETCWHNNRNNYLYLDGHAKSADWSSIVWQNLIVTIRPSDQNYNVNVKNKCVNNSNC